MEKERVARNMEKHPNQYKILRAKAKELANISPPSRERNLALHKLEESIMWVNAAIARHEKDAM